MADPLLKIHIVVQNYINSLHFIFILEVTINFLENGEHFKKLKLLQHGARTLTVISEIQI